jgi:anti-sigma factor RsiW
MSPSANKSRCEDIAALFVFYVCDELDEKERSEVDRHIGECENCRSQLAEEKDFNAALAAIPQDAEELDSAGILLSQCRSELAEKLYDLSRPAVKQETLRFSWIRRWMILHPAWSGGALVLVGLVLGAQSGQWFANHSESLGL